MKTTSPFHVSDSTCSRNFFPEIERPVRLTLVVPCYNEEATLKKCLDRVLELRGRDLHLEVIVVDDGSTDRSPAIAKLAAESNPEIIVCRHDRNRGKGAALRTGFQMATGDFVAVQDADLEYSPMELPNLLIPLVRGDADVVFGSRFLSSAPRRVLHFWHSMGNAFLTFVSNMFSDLNLTDMETCYKVFRRDVIQDIEIQENGFGVEPELVARLARKRLRIYEMGISYYGRTYAEGKKIRFRDALRALYCIFHYNAPTAPLPVQFIIYLLIGGVSAAFNLLVFLALLSGKVNPTISAAAAYGLAAALNYTLCIFLLFRHKARWNSALELIFYVLVVGVVGIFDVWTTRSLLFLGITPWVSKSIASVLGLALNFIGRRYCVFPEPQAGPWLPQLDPHKERESACECAETDRK